MLAKHPCGPHATPELVEVGQAVTVIPITANVPAKPMNFRFVIEVTMRGTLPYFKTGVKQIL